MTVLTTRDSRIFAEVEVTNLSGREALGSSRLVVHFRLLPRELTGEEEGVFVRGIKARVGLSGRTTGERELGWLQPVDGYIAFEVTRSSSSRHFSLEIFVTAQQIEEIEKHRGGGDINFSLELFVETEAEEERRPYHSRAQLKVRVAQSDWIKVLQQLGYTRYLLLEVPLLSEREHPELAQATQFLSQSQRALLNGSYREAARLGHDVVESLLESLHDESHEGEGEQLFAQSEQWDKETRIGCLRQAMRAATSPTGAEGKSAKIEWQRNDAILLNSMLAALLRWHSEEKKRG